MKRNNKKSSNLFDLAKTTVKTALWIVIVFALIFLLGRFIYNDLYPAPKIEIQAQGLTDVKLPSGMKNVVCHYSGFTSYFNPETHIPNCVAYEIIESETTGDEPRKKSFEADHTIDGCAESSDYRNSGYDRGHMAPAADMKWSEQAMDDCHLLTNICPQDRKVNGGPWATVEKNARKWTATHGTLYIVAGPILTDHITRYIGETHVPVPERFFKVIIAPDANPPMGIAFLMPNHPFQGGAQAAVTSIDNIEAITGYDFFSALPDDIEADVEAQHSMARWQHPKR